MHIPFFTRRQNLPTGLMTAKKTFSHKNNAFTKDVAVMELITTDECSNVAGGPQISNTPPV